MAQRKSLFKKIRLYIAAIFLTIICIILYPLAYTAIDEYFMKKPACDVSPKLAGDASHANAGCLIVHDGKILLTQSPVTKKLAIPGGTAKRKETSACTAHRETFEEAGIDVRIEKRIIVAKNGFEIFLCTPKTPINLSYKKKYEVTKVLLINNHDAQNYLSNYRYPNQLEQIVQYLQTNANQ